MEQTTNLYLFDAQRYQSYATPNNWQAESIRATKYKIDSQGILHFYVEDELIASFACGRWQRIRKCDGEPS